MDIPGAGMGVARPLFRLNPRLVPLLVMRPLRLVGDSLVLLSVCWQILPGSSQDLDPVWLHLR